jgi:hypothetical protein
MKESTRNLVASILKGDKAVSSEAFNAVIKSKLNDALDKHKAAIANSVFNKTS